MGGIFLTNYVEFPNLFKHPCAINFSGQTECTRGSGVFNTQDNALGLDFIILNISN